MEPEPDDVDAVRYWPEITCHTPPTPLPEVSSDAMSPEYV
jgi:hypothetical protein